MNVAEQFGRNLARIRRAADLSQDDLALGASIHRTEVSQLERGLRLARADTVVKLAGTLEIEQAISSPESPGSRPSVGREASGFPMGERYAEGHG